MTDTTVTTVAPAAPLAASPAPALTTELGGAPIDSPAAGAVDAAKPDGTKNADSAKPAEAPAALDIAKLTLPEGMKSDDPQLAAFSGLMADDKLSPQERGQKLLDLYNESHKSAATAATAAWKAVNEDWIKSVKTDSEIGGAKFETTKITISKAIDSLGPTAAAAFRQALDVTGAGNNPAIWKGLHAMAMRLTEGGHVAGNVAGSAKPSIGDAFFPNSKMT